MNTSLTSGVASSKKVKLTTAEACPAAKAAAFVCEDKSCPTERDRKRQTDRVHVVQINITKNSIIAPHLLLHWILLEESINK